MTRRQWIIGIAATLVFVSVCPAQSEEPQQPKNIFLMISDGIGFNGWEAAKFYQGSLPYDNEDFTFYGMTTYMKNTVDSHGNLVWSAGKDGAEQKWTGVDQGYDPAQMWSNFNYHRGDSSGDYYKFTDSAAAATAMYTGTKTYNSAVSYGVDGEELKTVAEYAAEQGKSTAAVSSVQFSHATPAAVAAHTYYRYNKTDIASQMVNHSDLDVIMGGDAYVDSESEYPGGVDGWKAQASASEFGNGFSVVDEASEWEKLVNNEDVPDKVAGTFSGSTLDGREKPKLADMTTGALNVLQKNDNGMFMMVEGGAVDWQNHANAVDLMLREQVDFDNSVQVVMDWVENNSDWNESLLIVTSDHETGGIWGPNTVVDDKGTPNDHTDDTINENWQNVVNNGEGNMPGVQYTSGGHTNALVPMWARGAGAEELATLVDGQDSTAADFWDEFGGGTTWDGSYIDNTDLFTVMQGGSTVPEPSTIVLLGLSGLLFGFWHVRSRGKEG